MGNLMKVGGEKLMEIQIRGTKNKTRVEIGAKTSEARGERGYCLFADHSSGSGSFALILSPSMNENMVKEEHINNNNMTIKGT